MFAKWVRREDANEKKTKKSKVWKLASERSEEKKKKRPTYLKTTTKKTVCDDALLPDMQEHIFKKAESSLILLHLLFSPLLLFIAEKVACCYGNGLIQMSNATCTAASPVCECVRACISVCVCVCVISPWRVSEASISSPVHLFFIFSCDFVHLSSLSSVSLMSLSCFFGPV